MDTYSSEENRKQYSLYRDAFDYEILKNIPELSGSIIEIGCGDGRFIKKLSKHFPDLSITGLDYSTDGIDICKKEIKGNFIASDVMQFEGQFDYVLCFQTLEHFENPDEVVTKMLTLGKRLIISVPNKDYDRCQDHLQFWTVEEFEQYMNQFIYGHAILIDGDQNILFISR